MKVLIAGAAGQLGRALQASATPGTDIVAPEESLFDICNGASVAALMADVRPDVVINAAAYTAVDRAESEAGIAHAVNVEGAGNLARAARAHAARFVHVSTDFVFDGQSATPYAPDARPNPLSVYGKTKWQGEQLVRQECPDALILRTAWVYAAQGQNFVRTMLRLMRERPELRVVADQVGTPTHAAGLARAIWALLAAGTTGTQHWTDAGVASWYDFAVAIGEEALALGLIDHAVPVVPIATTDYPTPARRPAMSILDKRACWAIIGPARHWRAELRLMLQEMKEFA